MDTSIKISLSHFQKWPSYKPRESIPVRYDETGASRRYMVAFFHGRGGGQKGSHPSSSSPQNLVRKQYKNYQ